MKLFVEEYKNYSIYFYSHYFLQLGKDIVDKNIKLVKELKVTDRNFVCKIRYLEKEYILKEPKNEYKKIQRKIMTLFKKGEVLSTLININNLIENKEYFAIPYLAVVKRKNGMIINSFLVMEITEEKDKTSEKYIKKIVDVRYKLEKNKIFHGDFNLSNILLNKGEIKFIDTQCKSVLFSKYHLNYDLLTLEESIYREDGIMNRFGLAAFYKKNLWYYLAYFRKRIKKGKECIKR
ncbi:MAG: RIO1 family regulatory kinase/ATPase [Fusobacteriaceae bacterium]